MVQIKFASGSILAVNWTIFASKIYEQMTKKFFEIEDWFTFTPRESFQFLKNLQSISSMLWQVSWIWRNLPRTCMWVVCATSHRRSRHSKYSLQCAVPNGFDADFPDVNYPLFWRVFFIVREKKGCFHYHVSPTPFLCSVTFSTMLLSYHCTPSRSANNYLVNIHIETR